MTHGWIAVMALAAALENAAPSPPPPGRLCVGERKTILTEGRCDTTVGSTIAVTPSDSERLFVWTHADATTVYIGTIPAKAQQIHLDPATFSAMQWTITGDRSRGWPVRVDTTVSAKEQWRWSLDADAAVRLRRLFVPRGRYAIQMQAEHHRTLRRGAIAATEETVSVGDLRLVPLPVARGIVIDVDEMPIAEATVSFPDGSFCASANEQGAFACELAEARRGEPVPEVLVIGARGFGVREMPIPPKSTEDIDFGHVRLAGGRVLTLNIVRPEPGSARVALYLDSPSRYEHSKLKTATIEERVEDLRFDVAEGKYLVLIEGKGALERLEVPLEVKAEDLRHEIAIEPYGLTGTVRFGDDPLQNGTMEIIAPDHTWRERVPVSGGAFGGTMWQRGKVRAFVSGTALGGNSELVQSPELGDDPSHWDVRIERRTIVGRVLDAVTRDPVASAELSVTVYAEGSRGYFSTKIQPDGSYQILAHKPGTYELRVSSAEHVPFRTEVRIAAEDRTRTVDVGLDRGVVQPIEIVTPGGEPLPNVLILEGVQADRHNPQYMSRSDSRGRYALRGTAGETRLLYFVPSQGSFAVARVLVPRSNNDAKPLQVVVPPPSASLRLRTVDADEKPVAAPVLIRYGGEFLPGAIARFVTGDWIGTPPSGEAVLRRFPAGAYELWALAGDRDEEQLIASRGTLRTPVRVGVSAGEQTVTLVAPPPEPRPPLGAFD